MLPSQRTDRRTSRFLKRRRYYSPHYFTFLLTYSYYRSYSFSAQCKGPDSLLFIQRRRRVWFSTTTCEQHTFRPSIHTTHLVQYSKCVQYKVGRFTDGIPCTSTPVVVGYLHAILLVYVVAASFSSSSSPSFIHQAVASFLVQSRGSYTRTRPFLLGSFL